MKQVLIAAAAAPAAGGLNIGSSWAADLTPLDTKDPTAAALGFAIDASTVDASKHPTYKTGQRCGTCAQFQGKPGDARGGCNVFVGHTVPQGGWCQVWAQKPNG
jgi:High potential iron-sulfur protein